MTLAEDFQIFLCHFFVVYLLCISDASLIISNAVCTQTSTMYTSIMIKVTQTL